MKQLNVLIATLLLTSLSLLPEITRAQDLEDLEVTMEVVDDIEGIADVTTEMPGPMPASGENSESAFGESPDAESGEESEEQVAEEDERFDRHEDEFVTDEDFTEEDESFDDEGNFEEFEEIDDDAYDIPMPEEDDMEEDPMEDEVV